MKKFLFPLSLILAYSNMLADNLQRNSIYVNMDVTTHILMPENLKLVDISTSDIVGNQCADNMVRIKPVNSNPETDSIMNKHLYSQHAFLGTVTLIGERHVAQYDILYEADPMKANAMYRVDYEDSFNYNNPETGMPESEMARLAWTAYGSKRKFHNIRENKNGIKAEVFNIYTVGDYFFIDFVLKNETHIPYDIAEMRINLTDKKQTKATNFQSMELTPLYILNDAKRFKKGYRQVIVLEKLTFPNDKILNIEVSENQISGRVVTIPIQYEDILNADCFDMDKINSVPDEFKNNQETIKKLKLKEQELQKKYNDLKVSNASMKQELQKTQEELIITRRKLQKFRNSVQESLEAFFNEDKLDKQNNIQMALNNFEK